MMMMERERAAKSGWVIKTGWVAVDGRRKFTVSKRCERGVNTDLYSVVSSFVDVVLVGEGEGEGEDVVDSVAGDCGIVLGIDLLRGMRFGEYVSCCYDGHERLLIPD